MAGRGELTDAAWERIEPLLPRVDGRGRPWRDHRQVVNGVLWRLRTGAPWRDLPERYGPWQTVYERFARWEADGTWASLLEHVRVRDDAVGRVEWTIAVDSTVIRAHQHAAGVRKKGAADGDELEDPGRSQACQALGRSRGGLTTKIHLAVDGRGLPLSIVLTPGNVNDATVFGEVLDGIRVPRAAAGRPRTTPERVLGDKAYSSRAIRHLLRRRGIAATIPERRDQEANRRRRGRLGGRPPAFDKEIYRGRNVVERCFARLKQFRAVATRFDKLADRYRAGVVLASLILWLREPGR
ncbi:IS5 family transposase [Streptomyces sp. SL13]|uniref:IS5 family transposase n=1 Tax=Streptantibioticus silvisoli TaxID=2705255 RepID=A0AA90H2F6_9ACTN|nr:IS5 family transposase [Streptantibioticus silvisoli]MDI5969430.1 IS5 family transposase [Streptantibioticus silvisoli]